MKKFILLFLLIFSFQVFSEEIEKISEDIYIKKSSKLFEGVDIDKILKEAVEKANKKLGIYIYLEEMNKLIEELKDDKSDPG